MVWVRREYHIYRYTSLKTWNSLRKIKRFASRTTFYLPDQKMIHRHPITLIKNNKNHPQLKLILRE